MQTKEVPELTDLLKQISFLLLKIYRNGKNVEEIGLKS